MALDKDVYFVTKTDTDWETLNPVIPDRALLFVRVTDENDAIIGIRAKLGDGSTYTDTAFMDDSALALKLTAPGGATSQVILGDGTLGDYQNFTLQDILDSYHLVTPTEWASLQQYSQPTPSVVITPDFSLDDISIGDAVSGNFGFTFVKTNNDSLKDTTAGNITVNQGSWSGDGDFDLKSVSSQTIIGANTGFSVATTVTFTVVAVDSFDNQVASETFDINVKYPVFAGLNSANNITSQNDLENLNSPLVDTPDGQEFYLNAEGTQKYFHVLIPSDLGSGVDIRLQSNPGPNTAGMVLAGTLNLDIGSVNKSYDHYVTDYTSAGELNLLIRRII